MLFRALDLDVEGEAVVKTLEGKLSLSQIEKDISTQVPFCLFTYFQVQRSLSEFYFVVPILRCGVSWVIINVFDDLFCCDVFESFCR